MRDKWLELSDGYGQSKWVAERMCVEAGSRGLPVSVLRPGNLSPSSKTGMWNKSDFIYMLLQASLFSDSQCALFFALFFFSISTTKDV